MKRYTVMVLWFMAILWGLTGCVVVVNNNMGHHIKVERKHDLQGARVAKDYTADITNRSK